MPTRVIAGLIVLALVAAGLAGARLYGTLRLGWQRPLADEIAAFAADDRSHPHDICRIVFVGSSSIHLWNTLAADMAPYPVLNRGFGGSEASDAVTYFNRLVPPRHPRAIVYYEGDNDIHDGKSPARVLSDFERFLDLKDRALGATPVYFVSVKPSPVRLAELAKQSELNADVQALARRRGDLIYVDVAGAMLSRGQPKDIFVADGLHMTEAGYAVWARIIKDTLAHTHVMARKCP